MSSTTSMPSPAGRPTAVFTGLAAVFATVMLGTTLPTPLYPLYQRAFGFSELMITVIFAVYAVGVILALIVTGRWSDQLGRRPVLGMGLACSAASAIVFLIGGGLVPLLLGRCLSGLSAGIFTGTATVAVVEAAPAAGRRYATLVATAANMGGLGLGPLLAGWLAVALPAPLHLCFALDLVLLALSGWIVYRAPETAHPAARPRLGVRRPRVPAPVRPVFVPAALAGFAGFAVLGLFTAIAPAFLHRILTLDNPGLTGSVVFLLFVGSMVGQSLQDRLPRAWRLPAGCLGLIVGMAGVMIAIVLRQPGWLVAGGCVAGLGQGASLRAGMGEISGASPADRRAEVASSFFVVAYVGLSLPVVGIGLAARYFGLAAAGLWFAGAVILLALLSMAGLIRLHRAVPGAPEHAQ